MRLTMLIRRKRQLSSKVRYCVIELLELALDANFAITDGVVSEYEIQLNYKRLGC